MVVIADGGVRPPGQAVRTRRKDQELPGWPDGALLIDRRQGDQVCNGKIYLLV
jgi:hypothetical protein